MILTIVIVVFSVYMLYCSQRDYMKPTVEKPEKSQTILTNNSGFNVTVTPASSGGVWIRVDRNTPETKIESGTIGGGW